MSKFTLIKEKVKEQRFAQEKHYRRVRRERNEELVAMAEVADSVFDRRRKKCRWDLDTKKVVYKEKIEELPPVDHMSLNEAELYTKIPSKTIRGALLKRFIPGEKYMNPKTRRVGWYIPGNICKQLREMKKSGEKITPEVFYGAF